MQYLHSCVFFKRIAKYFLCLRQAEVYVVFAGLTFLLDFSSLIWICGSVFNFIRAITVKKKKLSTASDHYVMVIMWNFSPVFCFLSVTISLLCVGVVWGETLMDFLAQRVCIVICMCWKLVGCYLDWDLVYPALSEMGYTGSKTSMKTELFGCVFLQKARGATKRLVELFSANSKA